MEVTDVQHEHRTVPLLQGKVAIVAGGARGLGEAQARALASHGAHVVIADIQDDLAAQVARSLSATADTQAMACHLDVASEAGWEKVVGAVAALRGRIDILVNSAGINERAGIGATSMEAWSRVMDVNVTGPMLGMKHVAPVMARTGGGAIVNICSITALSPGKGAAYTSSKWALRGLSKVAALEYAKDNIRVNTVCPGIVPTDLNRGQPYLETEGAMTPLGGRLATAAEIADVVLFLVSEPARFITGADIPVDGGYILRKP
jgi:NAD(P)-dependent dehydrogenase (short-subunit alcohol dehydrogenase family)